MPVDTNHIHPLTGRRTDNPELDTAAALSRTAQGDAQAAAATQLAMQQQEQPQQDPSAQIQQLITPSSMPPVAQMLQNYRAQMQAVRDQAQGSVKQSAGSVNPFAPSQDNSSTGPAQDDPAALLQEDRNHKNWLAMQDVSSKQSMTFDEDRHKNFIDNFANDHATAELAPNLDDTLRTLNSYVKEGKITKDQAIQMFSEAEPHIRATCEKFHGPHSPSSNMSMLDPVADHQYAMEQHRKANDHAQSLSRSTSGEDQGVDVQTTMGNV